MTTFTLSGLDAANPIGYLAALGTLRTAAGLYAPGPVAMRWRLSDGSFRPELRLPIETTEEALCDALRVRLADAAEVEAFAISDDLTLPIASLRAVLAKAASTATADERRLADHLCAFGSDAVQSRDNGKPSGKMADTAFRTMSGAGHQHFLGFMRTLVRDVLPDHLKRTLFTRWAYDDPVESHTMRWDPIDDVRYALRARDSSGDPERKRGGAMWGANRLAIAALPLFPTQPRSGDRLDTTGFSLIKDEGVAWTWPVWGEWASADVARSLVALRQLQQPKLERSTLAAMGIVEVFRCLRITQGKFRNFTVAHPV